MLPVIGEVHKHRDTGSKLDELLLNPLPGRFVERSADVRMAQYKTGSRSPKADLTAQLTHALDVSPQALAVPDIDFHIGLMAHLVYLGGSLQPSN